MKPRSLVLDLFGEYLRHLDDGVALGHLTTLLGDFGVAPATTRVTMSRLRREDWFTVVRAGRESRYAMTDTFRELLDEGRERIHAAPPTTWAGEWTMVIYQLSQAERAERDDLRRQLAWHGFGPLSTSTWLAPGDRRTAVRELLDELGVPGEVLRCRSDGLEHDAGLARRCWDLDALAAEYAEFNDEHRLLVESADTLTGADALVARTRLIARWRHFPFRDPQLPPPLRPDPWPGDEAYRIFTAAHDALGPAAREYVGTVVGRPVSELRV